MNTVISFWLPKKLKERIDDYCEENGITKKQFVSACIMFFFNNKDLQKDILWGRDKS